MWVCGGGVDGGRGGGGSNQSCAVISQLMRPLFAARHTSPLCLPRQSTPGEVIDIINCRASKKRHLFKISLSHNFHFCSSRKKHGLLNVSFHLQQTPPKKTFIKHLLETDWVKTGFPESCGHNLQKNLNETTRMNRRYQPPICPIINWVRFWRRVNAQFNPGRVGPGMRNAQKSGRALQPWFGDCLGAEGKLGRH